MIAWISGKIIQKTDKYLVVETGGIGYQIYVPLPILEGMGKVGTSVSLSTYMAVRENAMELFGFETPDEKTFFELLISVSGIGPRNALSIMSVAAIETLKRAIGSGDMTYLTKVSGIGKKTAEKIVVELRDKLATLGHKDDTGVLRGEADALAALQSLGYSQGDAREALKNVPDNFVNTNDRIKEALKILGR